MKISLIHPKPAGSIGGAEAVSAVILNVLAEQGHEVTYYSGPNTNFEQFKKYFGLEISSSIKKQTIKQPAISSILDRTGRFNMLSSAFRRRKYSRKSKKISQESDLVIFSANTLSQESKLSAPSIQYFHDHKIQPGGNIKLYNALVNFFGPQEIFDADLNLFNSNYLKSQFTIEGEVLHPPVKNDFQFKTDTEGKGVIVGRISKRKEVLEAIEIFSGLEKELVVAGFVGDKEYYRKVLEKEEEYEWLTVKTNLDRRELIEEIEEAEIGMNCRKDEPFGITAVEYIYGGTIPIVWHKGGPSEIVGETELTYSSIEEARRRIRKSTESREEILKQLKERADKFEAESFGKKFSKLIERFE